MPAFLKDLIDHQVGKINRRIYYEKYMDTGEIDESGITIIKEQIKWMELIWKYIKKIFQEVMVLCMQ